MTAEALTQVTPDTIPAMLQEQIEACIDELTSILTHCYEALDKPEALDKQVEAAVLQMTKYEELCGLFLSTCKDRADYLGRLKDKNVQFMTALATYKTRLSVLNSSNATLLAPTVDAKTTL